MPNVIASTLPPSIETPSPVAAVHPANTTGAVSEPVIRREDAPHGAEVLATEANGSSEPPVERESVLEQFKQAMASGGPPKAESLPPRVSRREQLAHVAEQPFVRRVMELFDVAPDKMRYTPPEGESN